MKCSEGCNVYILILHYFTKLMIPQNLNALEYQSIPAINMKYCKKYSCYVI